MKSALCRPIDRLCGAAAVRAGLAALFLLGASGDVLGRPALHPLSATTAKGSWEAADLELTRVFLLSVDDRGAILIVVSPPQLAFVFPLQEFRTGEGGRLTFKGRTKDGRYVTGSGTGTASESTGRLRVSLRVENSNIVYAEEDGLIFRKGPESAINDAAKAIDSARKLLKSARAPR